MCVCVCAVVSGCCWASVLALHLWPLSFPQPDAMLCYRTWAHAGNRATHTCTYVKSGAACLLKGQTHIPGRPAVNLTCTQKHREPLSLFFFFLLLFLPDIAAQIQPLNVYWAHVCRASGGTELMMSSWEALQSFHYVTVPWKIISAPNSFFVFLSLPAGGFAAFSSCFPGLCEGKPATALPMSLSQPCLPVANVGLTRILPHLYLGSQKDVLNKVQFVWRHVKRIRFPGNNTWPYTTFTNCFRIWWLRMG